MKYLVNKDFEGLKKGEVLTQSKIDADVFYLKRVKEFNKGNKSSYLLNVNYNYIKMLVENKIVSKIMENTDKKIEKDTTDYKQLCEIYRNNWENVYGLVNILIKTYEQKLGKPFHFYDMDALEVVSDLKAIKKELLK